MAPPPHPTPRLYLLQLLLHAHVGAKDGCTGLLDVFAGLSSAGREM